MCTGWGKANPNRANGRSECITSKLRTFHRGPIAQASMCSTPLTGKESAANLQEPVQAGEWIHIVGMAAAEKTSIYKNGEFKKCDRYTGTGPGPCHNHPPERWIMPTHVPALLRIGTRDRKSFFLGAIREVRIWRRALTAAEGALSRLRASGGLVAEYLLGRDICFGQHGSA
jgi:hypothetical protein